MSSHIGRSLRTFGLSFGEHSDWFLVSTHCDNHGKPGTMFADFRGLCNATIAIRDDDEEPEFGTADLDDDFDYQGSENYAARSSNPRTTIVVWPCATFFFEICWSMG